MVKQVEVRLAAGVIAGSERDGVRCFKGIPYAAPPTGARRFAVPQPVAPWSGVRDATVAGPSAPPQVKSFPGLDVASLVGDGGERGDDYLTLNIWAPSAAQTAPVMVFIHGGGFVVGNKDAPVQDGATWRRAQPPKVWTIALRVGSMPSRSGTSTTAPLPSSLVT